jgi:cell division protein FtsB
MQSFEEGPTRGSESTKLSAKLALLVGALLALILVTALTIQGGYVDVEQATQVSAETQATAAAIHDRQASR